MPDAVPLGATADRIRATVVATHLSQTKIAFRMLATVCASASALAGRVQDRERPRKRRIELGLGWAPLSDPPREVLCAGRGTVRAAEPR